MSAYTEEGGLPLPGLAEQNTLVVDADCRYSNTGEGLHRFVDPEDGQVYLYTPVRAGRRQADVRLLRPARPQGAVHRCTSTAPSTGRSSPTPAAAPSRPAPAGSAAGALRADHAHLHLPRRAGRRALRPRSPTRTTASTWGSTAAPRWPSTSTPTSSSGSPSRASTSTTGCSTTRTRSTSTTSCSCPSSTPARWRTPARHLPRGLRLPLEGHRARYERRAETILHELAHMWFGDLVTMRWWDDLWLNESFATYISTLCQAEATEYTTAWTTFANTEKAWAYAQDQLPSTHPIAADMPDVAAVEVNFDGITYAKGASVLKQLVAYVGREEFLAGVRAVLPRSTSTATPRWPTCSARWRRRPAATSPSGPTSGCGPARSTRCGRCSSSTDDGRYASFAIEQTRRARAPGAAQPPARRRALQRAAPTGSPGVHRVELDVDRRADRGRRAGRPPGRRPGAGQRRRPDLRQAAARRAVAGHAARAASAPCPTRWPGRCAGRRPGT